MGSDSDLDFQQFIPASAAKAALVLTHPETQAIDMCLIWEFPSQGSSFSTSIGSGDIGSNQAMSSPSPNLLRSAGKIWNHSESRILPGVDMKYLRLIVSISVYTS